MEDYQVVLSGLQEALAPSVLTWQWLFVASILTTWLHRMQIDGFKALHARRSPSIHHRSLGQNKIIRQLILMKVKCDQSSRANANLCTKAEPSIEMAEIQRVEKSCLVKSHISTSLRFQQEEAVGSECPGS